MATATDIRPTDAAADAQTPAKGRKKVVLVLVLVLLLAGGGGAFLVLGGGSGDAHAEPVPMGPVVDLEPLTLNLADGHFLKVGLSLQLAADSAAGHGGDPLNGARARDAAIGIFGKKTYDQLLTPAGRTSARTTLEKEVRHRYPGEVVGVYLTEFVMQ